MCGNAKTGATGTFLQKVPMMSACDCKQSCEKNPLCKAWQYCPQGCGQGPAPACYLKSTAGLAPNGRSVAAEAKPGPLPPPPPPPPPAWPLHGVVVRVSLLESATRPAVKYGFGNELCWQSVNDTKLQAITKASGATIGRYPGGTPSDYWHWDTGWGTDLGSQKVYKATPKDWGKYVKGAGTEFTIFDTNQLTMNLSYAIAGLKAHEATGSVIKYVELGNEMYDGSRGDVVSMYPNGSVYAEKMAVWTKGIHTQWPDAQVAVIGERWNSYHKPREDTWNKDVLQNPVTAGADAATLHIYCPFNTDVNASDPANVAAHLATAFFRVAQNKQMVATDVPARLRLWVTEMGVYPPGVLLSTWLEALFYALMDLGLPSIAQLDIVTP